MRYSTTMILETSWFRTWLSSTALVGSMSLTKAIAFGILAGRRRSQSRWPNGLSASELLSGSCAARRLLCAIQAVDKCEANLTRSAAVLSSREGLPEDICTVVGSGHQRVLTSNLPGNFT